MLTYLSSLQSQAPKKAKGKTLALTDFLADQSLGDWADDVAELPSAPGGPSINSYAGPGPRGDRDRSEGYERQEIVYPTRPPYTAFVGNLSFDISERDLDTLFRELRIKSIRLIKDIEDKPKGFGYVEFDDVESLKAAVAMSGESVQGRSIRVDVSAPKERPGGDRDFGAHREPREESKADQENQWRRKEPIVRGPSPARSDRSFGGDDRRRSGFGGGFDRDRERGSGFGGGFGGRGDRDREGGFNRGGGFNRDREGGFRDREGAFNRGGDREGGFQARRAQEPPAQRKALALKPRTVTDADQPLSPTISEDSTQSQTPQDKKPKFNPFGAAKPRDEAEIQRKFEERQREKEEARKAAEEAERKAKEAAAKEEAERKKREEEERAAKAAEAKAAKEAKDAEDAKSKAAGGRPGKFGGNSTRPGTEEKEKIDKTEVSSWRRETPVTRPAPTPASSSHRGGNLSSQNRHSKESGRGGYNNKYNNNRANEDRPQLRENSKVAAPIVLEGPKEIKVQNPYSLLEQDDDNNDESVAASEARFATRALRATASLRRRLNQDLLNAAINAHYPKDHASKSALLQLVGKSDDYMDVEMTDATAEKDVKSTILPEVDFYFGYLVVLYLHDTAQFEKGLGLTTKLVQQIQALNRRTMDQLAAKIYFYYERFFEAANRLAEIRPTLLAAQRTATLRHDAETQAVLINLLLRNYLHFNLYDQADKLVSKTTFPESAGNNQQARYLYYLGRIKAIQLDYTASHQHLLQAIRKAPQSAKTAGFQQAVYKLAIIVQLLTGEIPERSVFRQATLRKSLVPYFHITQAVRVGDLTKFQDTLAKYIGTFRADKTYTLILRLRHNVIKAGVRMISLSYSRISLRDICVKLQLDSEEDAEYIVSKAIRDGVIDAIVDHEHGYMKSKENADIYSTTEPQAAFHQRISFCLDLHNESVKAMRYPFNSHRKELASADAIREEERKLASEIAEGDLDEDEDMGDF
ncbi:26S proteasome non-ATPase regulatory subunit [Chytridiales sp. JEL 0842]|nr:26S proteasome non-ATPase regulatory subunit [Chytridiales sp. JEL 0842]